MNATVHRQLNRRKRRILRRIENQPGVEGQRPMMAASNIRYEIADRTRALSPGGIGAIHLLAQRLGLARDIDEGLHLLKRHLPYHESDHVLNIAYNLLAGGSRIEHLEVRRNDEVYLDALGARRIPDPTTAGDFCRRFTEADVERLMGIFNETRLRAWKEQPDAFFDEAFLDADGALAPSDAWCKQGVDIAYDGGITESRGREVEGRRGILGDATVTSTPFGPRGRGVPRHERVYHRHPHRAPPGGP